MTTRQPAVVLAESISNLEGEIAEGEGNIYQALQLSALAELYHLQSLFTPDERLSEECQAKRDQAWNLAQKLAGVD